jgi:hypothetical protein
MREPMVATGPSTTAVAMEDWVMILMFVYVGLVAVGEVLAFIICQLFDQVIPSAWSMVVYMIVFFGVLWAAWPLSVSVTEKWIVPQQAAH